MYRFSVLACALSTGWLAVACSGPGADHSSVSNGGTSSGGSAGSGGSSVASGGTSGTSGGSAAGGSTAGGNATGGSAAGGSSSVGGSVANSGGTQADGGSQSSAGSGGDGGTSSDGDTPTIGDLDNAGRSLVWADEFNGPEIDREIWGNETGFVRNNELQNYTTADENQFIQDGSLVIKGIYVGGSGQGAYTSASLHTNGTKTFQYGRIEARIQAPGAKGSWPAFWMLPPNKGWPEGGEIDVMEWVSQEPNGVHGTAHFQQGGVHASSGTYTDLGSPVPSAYHVYAVEWTETAIDWYVDATHYHSFDISSPLDGETPFNAPFYMILNYAIGGVWPEAPDSAQYPSEMRVDWVRVWQ